MTAPQDPLAEIASLRAEVESLRRERDDKSEHHRMQLTAIEVAANCNTLESARRQRVNPSNPYWSSAYAATFEAVAREMRERARADLAESRLAAVEKDLDVWKGEADVRLRTLKFEGSCADALRARVAALEAALTTVRDLAQGLADLMGCSDRRREPLDRVADIATRALLDAPEGKATCGWVYHREESCHLPTGHEGAHRVDTHSGRRLHVTDGGEYGPWKHILDEETAPVAEVRAELTAEQTDAAVVEVPASGGEPCATCDGCGQVADTEEGGPWTNWTSLPPGSDLAVRMGLVTPKPCPECKGGNP